MCIFLRQGCDDTMVQCRRPPAPRAYSLGNNPAARRPTPADPCHRRYRADTLATQFNEELHSESAAEEHPEAALLRTAARESLREALDRLPPEFREVIVLRELEGLSYKEISDVAGVPVGTVMSRLSRARKRLQDALCAEQQER